MGVFSPKFRSIGQIFYAKNLSTVFRQSQDNVRMNTESVRCISTVCSICQYKYNQWAV